MRYRRNWGQEWLWKKQKDSKDKEDKRAGKK